ncbi:CBS domain-containing protein [Thalassolituus alkanivorans]|uniref:CBS domain-containing protein n=1 Tax=Thalassolituus alkanivorans TaxID=2881055 RepID=UPI001E41DD50|nr:CBS domain-containing protein [Thalassolituus alkanivorans]MCB2385353.1 CBS domain-containing protein [Thalassolituus alkanivorans]MCB2422248.1 CBS domain-containing protein [Thalassolituus alkanivorans]
MSLIVFDMGIRVETPLRPDKNRIKATAASSAVQKVRPGDSQSPAERQAQQVLEHYAHPQKTPDSIAFAADIMHTPVLTLTPDDTVQDGWNKLAESGYHHLPVVDQENKVLAIISDRDLMHALMQKNIRPGNSEDIWENNILNYAIHPVICVMKNADIRQTSNILFEYNIGALPIIDDHHTLCGIITRTDILKLLRHYGPMELWA